MNQGVLTAANAEFFPTLGAMALSCAEQGVALAAADHGLMPHQREWLQEHGVIMVRDSHHYSRPLEEAEAARTNQAASNPRAWHKLLVCGDSPFDNTLWIDSDAIPLRGLDKMFAALSHRPFVTRDGFISQKCAINFYKCIARKIGNAARLPLVARINSGVFGFRRGDEWMQDWSAVCAEIFHSPRLMACCTCRDQSALVVVLTTMRTPPQIIESEAWNYPANGLLNTHAKNRKPYPLDPAELLAAARADHPAALVVHWMGKPKPWHLVEAENVR